MKHDVSHEARNAHGEWTSGGIMSAKAMRAKLAYKKSNKEEQRYAESQEITVAKAIGGYQSKVENDVFDVYVKRKKRGLHGVEVKTMVNADTHEITMKFKAKHRKLDWGKETKNPIHTVILDHRAKFNNGEHKSKYSGHEIYYKRGVGKIRLSGAYKVKNYAELKRLMEMPYSSLPAKAQGITHES